MAGGSTAPLASTPRQRRTPSSPGFGPAGAAPRRRPFRTGDRRLSLALPAGVLLAALALWPLLQLGRMSVSGVTGATLNRDWEFVGFDNYAALFANPDFLKVVGNTLAFVAVVTIIGMIGGFAVAVSVWSGTRGGSFLLGMMVFVWALPPVINGSIWKFLLGDHGLVNEVLRSLHLTTDGIGFLYDPAFALWSVALVNAWAVVPFNALIFRAALLSVDESVLEAAEVDGARPRHRIRYILAPHARSAATVLTVLTIVYAFRSFDFIYVMTSGGPGTSSATLPYLAYAQAFQKLDYGSGAATALLALAVVIVFALVYARDVRRNEEAV
ncbi:carbohydrate ABC transporter permease [Compostimonas suwonensis]|uniref:Multiple sugar transport system permease protein n=1 Tax=Compostimonas suwonensis TaxID=1048394 RepID=A0A2M9C3Q2_9MICO|nr:sugar ABC transporter permease [Compostimonas suwonensis]PJJ65087.1 multiple sugar transport system permease protein [Compostimonas suwonensis]